ncbi:MAG: carboxypeptidase-like regulatory domain-containing protein, partial [Saprospiraceae bacterium]|nr:carboxypeptidase-like regulatory domain-containing protein [Saprospiraceae bacterium]
MLVVACLAMGNIALAQRAVEGVVTDATTGEPLIGANVLVVGTSSGTVTDFDGTYTINVPEGYEMLEFSYTGYSSETVTLGPSDIVNVTLSPGELLEEVVVVGYGTQKAKEVTSAVASVKEEDFNKGNVNNPEQLL